MMRHTTQALILALALASTGCGGGDPAPTPPSSALPSATPPTGAAPPTLVTEVGKPARTDMASLGEGLYLEVRVLEILPATEQPEPVPARVRYSMRLRRADGTGVPGLLSGDEVDMIVDGGKATARLGEGPGAYYVESSLRVVDATHVAWMITGRRGY